MDPLKETLVTKIREVPHFNKKKGISGFFHFIFAAVLWTFMLTIGVFVLYANWVTSNMIYLLNLIKPKHYYIPLWFSILLTIIFFPITIVIILVATLIKIVKR